MRSKKSVREVQKTLESKQEKSVGKQRKCFRIEVNQEKERKEHSHNTRRMRKMLEKVIVYWI